MQRRNDPRGNIFKNVAVYLANRLTENYCLRLKVQFVCQQSQTVQRAELVHLASPCPICRVQIIAPLLRLIETHFHNLIGKIFIFVILSQILVLKNPVQGRPHLPRHYETPGRIRKNITCPNSPTGQANPQTMNRCCTCHKRLPKLLLPIMFTLPFPVNFKFLFFYADSRIEGVFFPNL